MSAGSEQFFYLIDHDGIKRVPHKITAGDGRYGYAVHPKGKGNDASAADYTEDEKRMVQAVVLHGFGVRTRAVGGPRNGQVNTLGLGGGAIRGYWLAPDRREWVGGAMQPSEESHISVPDASAAPTIEEDIVNACDLPADETERKAVIAARRGQGRFRKALDSLWSTCAVTGCSNPALLRASHIKPWRDSDNHDRLFPYNGLLLATHLDAAFDKGLISFDDDGCILVDDSRLSETDSKVLGIHSQMKLRGIHAMHKPYLAEHRRLHRFED